MERRVLTLDLDTLRARTSVKWTRYPPDVLPVWVAEMDVMLAPSVAAALRTVADTGDTGYPGTHRYARGLGRFAASRWGWEVDPGQCELVPDVMTGVSEVLRLLTRPGDAVVVNPPVYPPFWSYVEHADRRVVEAPLTPTGRLDPTSLERAFGESRRASEHAAYLLCSPHNPTGTVHTREELDMVGALADEYGVRVVVDEIHAPLVRPADSFVPYLTTEHGRHGFSVISAAKAWNLAGLKAGLAVAGTDAVDDLRRLPEVVHHGAGHVAVQVHVAGFEEGVEWLDDVLLDLQDNRELMADLLATHLPPVKLTPADGTFFAWLDCRGLGLGDNPAHEFLHTGRVALNPGHTFGTPGLGFARLNLATSPEILTEAVRRMTASVSP